MVSGTVLLCPVEQVLLHSSAMNRLAHGEAILETLSVARMLPGGRWPTCEVS